MIQLIGVSKLYPHQVLFENIDLSIQAGEKIGLTGRNGHGKSTLLRLICGQETPDSGKVVIPKDYRIGFMEQKISFSKPTVMEECISALPEHHRNDTWLAEKTLFGLGFGKDDLAASPHIFSGGFQVRINLAKLLISSPDMLLLDEPTNFLDIISIRWLRKFLEEWKGEFILITHDRGFMDKVINHTVAIHRRVIRKMKGDTSKMYLQIAKDEEIYEKTRVNDAKERKRIEEFITHFRAKARLAGMVQSRIKTLQKIEKKDHLAEIKDLDFAFQHLPISGKWVFEAKNLAFGYQTDNIIRDFSFALEKNERIAIIGKNGKGKSTLIRLLSGELTPRNGEIVLHPQAVIGYFGQTNRDTLTPHLTVEEEISGVMPVPSRERARSIAGSMLFEGEMSQKTVDILSGGERARVMLAKIIASPCSILLLDEPTNHLDMQSADALLEALDQFEGALVMVTHNEMFLRSIPTKLIVFDDNGAGPDGKSFPYIFHGTYDEFLEKCGWADERISGTEPEKKVIADTVINKKDLRKIRAEILEEKSRTLNPLKKRMDSFEAEIVSLENLIDRSNNELIEAASKSDTDTIRTLSVSISESKSKLDHLYNELESVTVEYETKTEYFSGKLLPYDNSISAGD
jgi:ATP-binding cassette subfamily F protein 3